MMRRTGRIKLVLFASFALSVLSAQAAIGDKIGTNQPVGDGAHLTSFSAEAKSVTLSNGNVFFYWADQGTLDGDLGGVFGKVVAQNGTVVKATFNLDTAATGNQGGPFAAPLAGGGVAVAWNNSQTTSSTSPTNMFVRVFDNSGNAVSSPVQTNETVTTVDVIPQVNGNIGIVPLQNGNFMAVIRINERGAAPNEDDDLYQLFSAAGAKIGTNQPIGDGAHLTSFSAEAKSVTLSNGNVFFYWADQGTLDGDLGGVFGKVVAQNGTVVKATFNLDTAATGNQGGPFAAPLAGGGVAVAWNNSQTTSSTSPTNMFVRVFDNSGNAVSSPVQTNETVTTVDVIPQVNGNTGIVPLQNGNFMAVIRINERGAAPNEDDDLYQLFSAAGAKIGTNQPIGDGAHLTSFSAEAKSVTLSNGNVFFYWADQGTLDGDLGGVFGKVVAQNGTVVKATFNLDTAATGNQGGPFAAPLAGGGVAVAWNNSQTTSSTSPTNMFVRVFDNSGNAVSSPVQTNETVTTVDVIPQVNGNTGIVPLQNGNFMAVIRINERGAAPNEDDDMYQLFEGPVVAPEIIVTETVAGNVPDNGAYSFGATPFGTSVTKTFTVTNSGTAVLNLSGLTVPAGFTIAQSFGSTAVAANGGSTTFQITMNAGAAGSPSGPLSFANDDGDENPYNFTISGTVNRPTTTVQSLTATVPGPQGGNSVSWQIVFNAPLSGLTASNFSLVNVGLGGTPVITGVGAPGGAPSTTWNISASTGTGSGTLGLNLANDTGLSHEMTNEPFTGGVYTIDKTAPVFISLVRLTPGAQATNADTLVFRATFNEGVTGVNAADFTVTGTTAGITDVASVSSSQYDITVSGGNLASLNGIVGLNPAAAQNITDLAGNGLPFAEPATDETYTLDNLAPTVEMTSATGNPTGNAAIPVTVQFSETVVNFMDTDIVPVNATVTAFSAVDGDTYAFNLVPSGPGVTVTANIAANVAQDGAGNNNSAAVAFSRSILDSVNITATTPTAVEGGATGLYTFTRGVSSGALTVNFQLDAGSTAAAGTDFSLSGTAGFDAGTGAGTVVIPDGQLSATVSLTALVETIQAAEADETVRLNVVSTPGLYFAATSPNDNATVTIAQNGFLVTTTIDGGAGSLRQAVLNANAIAGHDIITFSDGTGGTTNFTDAVADTITLSGGQISLDTDITITGPGADLLILQNTAAPSSTSRVFLVPTGAAKTVRLSGLTVTGGNSAVSGGGGLLIDSGSNATVSVIACAISGNLSSFYGGGIFVGSSGTLSVVNSTISGNTSTASFGGGGIDFGGTALTLINSTLSGNSITGSSSFNGGAIYSSAATVTIRGCTITNNTGVGGTSGVRKLSGTVTVANSIIAGNVNNATEPDIIGVFISGGGNLIGNAGTAAGFTHGTNSDQVGTGASPINPQLAALANNGGRTQTHALLAASTALNAGLNAQIPTDTFDVDGDSNTTEVIDVDQRGPGFIRAIGTVDIGAFELQKSVSITALDAAKAEGNGGGMTNFTFTVARTGDLADSVTLDWTVTGSGINPADGADFAATTGQVILNATEGSKVVNVVVNGDNIVEPAEGFTVTLSNPTNGYVLTTATADGTINSDDSATLLLTGGTSKNEGDTGTTTYTFTATLSQPVQGGVSVAYTTDDGTATTGDGDYTDNDGSLSFPGAVVNEQRTFDVLVNGDNKVEANEDFTAVLGAVTGGHGAVTVSGSSQTGTITNDDSAVVAVAGNVSQLEGSGAQAFSITLSNPVDINVTVNFATSNGTAIEPGDYTATSGTATFVAGTTTAQVVNVTVMTDAEFEGDEIYNFTLSDLSAPSRSVTLGTSAATGTIQNDDTLTISITATDDSADENTAASGIWRVTRNGTLGAVTANLEIDFTSTALTADWAQSGASFISMEPGGIGTVTIPDGQSFVDIVLIPIADVSAEADETVQLNLTAGTGYTPSNGATRTVTIARNDFGVTNVNDSGEGTLRQAVDNANVLGGNPTITFEGPVFADAVADAIILATALPDLATNLEIAGTGSGLLSVSGDDSVRTFVVNTSAIVTMTDLTLTEGYDASSGGAVFNNGDLRLERCIVSNSSAADQGGAIQNNGMLSLVDCIISANTANDGAGIISYGRMTVRGSTFDGNIGTGEGGAIFSSTGGPLRGSFDIFNSTFSGNSAGPRGGAISLLTPLPHTITNSTFTANSVTLTGSSGGGIETNGGLLTLHNTLVSGNMSTFGGITPNNISGTVDVTSSYNLIGIGGAGGLTDATNGNLVGADPKLGPLQDNGGHTPTHALLVGSHAIDAGDPAFDGGTFTPPLTNDQRGAGFTRVRKGLAASASSRIDIGAYELIDAPVFNNDDLEINTGSMPLDLSTASGVTPPGGTFSGTGVSGGFFDPTGLGLGAYTVTYTVGDTNGANSTDLTITVTERPSLTVTSTADTISKIDGQTTLREALAYAATLTGAQIVDFSDNTTGGAVNFHDAAADTITLGGTQYTITTTMTINGPGAKRLTISGDEASRIFAVVSGGALTLRGVTLTKGSTNDPGTGSGGAVFCSSALSRLTIEGCLITDNHSNQDAGAIGIYDNAIATIRDSTITGNSEFGGGISGGAIVNYADLTLVNSTVSGNETTSTASTLAAGGIVSFGSLTVLNSTITGNEAAMDGPAGGMCFILGSLTMHNSIVAGNVSGPASTPSDITGTPAPLTATYNIIGDAASAGGIIDGTDGNHVGDAGAGTLVIVDILDPILADHGGPTPTHKLVLGSRAIDGGDPAFDGSTFTPALTNDQRGAGFTRVTKGLATSVSDRVDIGAYELFAAPIFLENQLSVVTGGSPLDLALESGVNPPGGTFSGTGVSGGFFDPRSLTPGDYLVTYTVTDAFGVENAATLIATVTNLPSKLKVDRPKRFKATEVGRKGSTQRIRITNTGGLPLTGLNVRLSGPHRKDYRLVKPSVTSLAPSGSTLYRLSFKPRSAGVRKATLTVTGGGQASAAPVKGVGLKSGPGFPVRDPDKFNNRE